MMRRYPTLLLRGIVQSFFKFWNSLAAFPLGKQTQGPMGMVVEGIPNNLVRILAPRPRKMMVARRLLEHESIFCATSIIVLSESGVRRQQGPIQDALHRWRESKSRKHAAQWPQKHPYTRRETLPDQGDTSFSERA